MAVPAVADPARDPMPGGELSAFAHQGMELLAGRDPELYRLLVADMRRQADTLMLIAASSVADPSVVACEGTALMNVTGEGYPGARYHAGCGVVDDIERLAVDRAKTIFGARYCNVQPHSGSSANLCALFALLSPGDTILGLDLDSGGHLSHGSAASVTGRYFTSVAYEVDGQGLIDYDGVRAAAERHRPKVLICGASAYPRVIDFARLREIADAVGAYLLADISHVAGLVAAGEHPSPIDHAHITTTSTYKQLYGPRGGLILMGKDANAPAPGGQGTLEQLMQRAVFPQVQGTPNMAAIAAKARAFAMVGTKDFRNLARLILRNARTLADEFAARGFRVLTGGTDTHMVLLDLQAHGMSGLVAERALEECLIVTNKNRIPGDTRPARITSGLRLGTNTVALRGMRAPEMRSCADLVRRVLDATDPRTDADYVLDPAVRGAAADTVRDHCQSFPLPGYPSR